MVEKRIKFVKKEDMHNEFINSQQETIIFELNEGWNDYNIMTSFDVYYKDRSNNKIFIGRVKLSIPVNTNKIIYEIYNIYINECEDKKCGVAISNIEKLKTGLKGIRSVGEDLIYYQRLRSVFDSEESFDEFLCDFGDVIRDIKLRDCGEDIKLQNTIDESLFRTGNAGTDAEYLYEISRHFKKNNIDIKGYQEERFSDALLLLISDDSSFEKYEELKELLSVNKYRSEIANRIMESLEGQNKGYNNKVQIQKILNYIVTSNKFGKELSKRAGKLCEDGGIITKIDELESLLVVDNVENIELGHYTSLNTLPLLIKEYSEENPPTVRLTNSNQMNDPSEGKVLYKYIFGNTNGSYKVPSCYISSATTALDNLPMWKQYADNCSGAVMVYDKKFLKEVLNSESNKLYQVCYIKENKEINENDIEVRISSDDDLIESKIKEALYSLKKEIVDKSQDAEKKDRIEKYLAGIGYLFKNMDYSYESEYRIVKNLKPESSKIVVEKSGGLPVPLLYTYLTSDNNELLQVRYSKVQLGPKAIDIDYVEPYVRFISNGTTDVIESNVNFRD